jgi:four helix bundle protein
MNMEAIRSHRDLTVSNKAIDMAMAVFEVSKKFPAEERYSMTDQVRRSSRSVAANIAEAWRKRRYSAAFVSKLSNAEAESAETQTHVEIARRCRYLSDDSAMDLDKAYEEIVAMLATTSNHPEKWCL